MGSEELGEIRREVLVDVTGTVLEIGVGPGYNIPFYRNISKLYALEPSKELMEIAKTRVGTASFPVEFLNSKAESIPLPNQSVDTAVSTWTLCSVNDPQKVLNEIARVLRAQGQFIFVDHGASNSSFIHVIQTIFTFFTKYFTGNCHYNRPIEKLIREAGFEIQKIEYPIEHGNPIIYNYHGIAVKQKQTS
jgi:ubiquinone/menaquinone biosynthesis C-methylase UbiE